MNIIEATAEALKVNGYIKRKGHPFSTNAQAADLLADDWEVVSEGEGKCTEAETDKLTASAAIDTAKLQEGIAELKVLPIFERKPQMPEEKQRLAKMLIDFVEYVLGRAATVGIDDSETRAIAKIAEVAADLVR